MLTGNVTGTVTVTKNGDWGAGKGKPWGNEKRRTLLLLINVIVLMFDKVPENREENKIISPCCLHIALKAGTGNGGMVADNGNGNGNEEQKLQGFNYSGKGIRKV